MKNLQSAATATAPIKQKSLKNNSYSDEMIEFEEDRTIQEKLKENNNDIEDVIIEDDQEEEIISVKLTQSESTIEEIGGKSMIADVAKLAGSSSLDGKEELVKSKSSKFVVKE